jgi:bacillithiol biosynthesis cysteine-adding enzyme BshC
VKAHCLPFSEIPHTTRLFADFLSYTPPVQSFYPRSPQFSEWVKEESQRIQLDLDRRCRVAEILQRQNQSFGVSTKTLANLDRLRNGAAAIVTGQQVGLFGGPMFSIYKALTAVKLAEEATKAGVNAVPIFWLATYDHDLVEVNHVSIPALDGQIQTLATPSHGISGAPVSTVRLGDEIQPVLEQAAALLGETDTTTLLRETYRPGETLGTAFARFYARLFADWGVILLDASDPELHRVAEPIYRMAIERANELTPALLARGDALEAAGYHQQVKVMLSSTLLFKLRDGVRTPIHRHEGQRREFFLDDDPHHRISEQDLLNEIASHPEQFSPNVLLRPIVEDFLLPTLAYTGGAAEAAYFAQAAVVYESILGRTTPIVPRYSGTIVEPKLQRLLERYQLSAPDVFGGPEALRQKLAGHSLPEDLQNAFDSTRAALDTHLGEIQQKLARLDRTLVDAGETAVSKMRHQLDRLHTQAARAEAQKVEVIGRHAQMLSQNLYPNRALQERGIGGVYFLARYGQDLLHQLYDSMHSDCHDHQIVEL